MLIQQIARTNTFPTRQFQAIPNHFSASATPLQVSEMANTVTALQQLFQGFNSFLQSPDAAATRQPAPVKATPSPEWLEAASERMQVLPGATTVKSPRNEWLEIASEKMHIPPKSAKAASGLKIAVIDDFVAENDGFNHGEMVASTIENGGALAKDLPIETLRFNIDQPGQDRTKMISSSLAQILQKVRNGEEINAVNLSQQAFTQTETTRHINEQVDQLEDLGVAVVVAAGNEPGKVNELARSANIVVENTDADGKRAATSGLGNVRAEGNSTSKAAANFSTVAAFRQAKSRNPRSAAFSAAAARNVGPDHR